MTTGMVLALSIVGGVIMFCVWQIRRIMKLHRDEYPREFRKQGN